MRNKLTYTCCSLPEKTPIETTSLLQEWLADSIDLMMQAKQAHRKVKDHHFTVLHVLFDKVFNDTAKCVDLIARRLVQLGGIRQGTLHVPAQKFSPQDIVRGKKHVAEQAQAIAFYVELMRKAGANSTRLRDADTLTQISREDDMDLWFVEVHEASEN